MSAHRKVRLIKSETQTSQQSQHNKGKFTVTRWKLVKKESASIVEKEKFSKQTCVQSHFLTKK